jgi:hypothetical protein
MRSSLAPIWPLWQDRLLTNPILFWCFWHNTWSCAPTCHNWSTWSYSSPLWICFHPKIFFLCGETSPIFFWSPLNPHWVWELLLLGWSLWSLLLLQKVNLSSIHSIIFIIFWQVFRTLFLWRINLWVQSCRSWKKATL